MKENQIQNVALKSRMDQNRRELPPGGQCQFMNHHIDQITAETETGQNIWTERPEIGTGLM